MRRREFITLVGGAAVSSTGAAELVALAPEVILSSPPGLPPLRQVARTICSTGGVLERTQTLAKELVELQPDVILAGSTPSVSALMRETRTIPIIFTNISDPVDTGLMPSLARPGANVTGFTAFEYSLAGKWLEILKEAVPHIIRPYSVHTHYIYARDATKKLRGGAEFMRIIDLDTLIRRPNIPLVSAELRCEVEQSAPP